MSEDGREQQVVSASRAVAAPPGTIFELIADPSQQPRWDGNDNLAEAETGQRVTAVGDVFTMVITNQAMVRENHVVEFAEGRLIAWRPAEPGQEPAGHLWRWELEQLGDGLTRVTHTYDWSELHDPTGSRVLGRRRTNACSPPSTGWRCWRRSWRLDRAGRAPARTPPPPGGAEGPVAG
ncbi:hypothetical protein GCM10009584_07250 [Ornithinimicrobium humiphilum]|uniref:Polyketide cyclase/dehydrase/lipid transport protein n=1 Tax=Ornithinimicrobium humiphilum TaxID=125288 RepID=A0A543KQ99_9MICO|nr:polyketide cyclase/dehydrase/lipid transport protein [Ornithinimicrobium humiphilum]